MESGDGTIAQEFTHGIRFLSFERKTLIVHLIEIFLYILYIN